MIIEENGILAVSIASLVGLSIGVFLVERERYLEKKYYVSNWKVAYNHEGRSFKDALYRADVHVPVHTVKIELTYIYNKEEVSGVFVKARDTGLWMDHYTGDPVRADDENLSDILDYITHSSSGDFNGNKEFNF